MSVDFLLERMRGAREKEAVAGPGFSATYGDLLDRMEAYGAWVADRGIGPGDVVSFDGDYSPRAIALFLALARRGCVTVPLSRDSHRHFAGFREIAATGFDISLEAEEPSLVRTGRTAGHELYRALRERGAPGLVLFSSGSTGRSKGIVQDLARLADKFREPRKALRMLIFLQLDHIGGVNSLLYTLANQGAVIVPGGRSPEAVCRAIEACRAELLPTSPTFLNLLALSRAYESFDLSSLRTITYGTEPMQASTLERLARILPHAVLQQTYGLSEVGILRSKSRASDSLWMKVGGGEFTVKVVDGTLRIKADSAMLGYLNAPSPFDAEGFLDTGDMVEQDGEWIRILGRKSEIINVGGFKVFPAEVESVLLELDNVEDAVVFGLDHPITGKLVAVKVKLAREEALRDFKARMLSHCRDRLQAYKIPGKVVFTGEDTFNERYKRMRRLEKDAAPPGP